MNQTLKRFMSPRILITAIIVWVGLCLLITGSFFLTGPTKKGKMAPTAVVTVIYAPTVTATVNHSENNDQNTDLSVRIGGYVKITGTGGDGLRIRSGPGIENTQKFFGQEGEIFVIKDGPVNTGGYSWWYLVAPNDPARNGWAAGEFLIVIPKP